MIRTNFYYPQELLNRLKLAKKKTGLTVSELLRRAAEKLLQELGI